MSKIMISELETAESVQDSDWIAIDNGEYTKKIAVEDFEETASSSARSYAEAAAQSAEDASDSADAASATSAEVTLQINRAVSLVGQAEEYATAASTSAGQASTSATTARTQAGIATTKANEAAASAATINDQVEMAQSWAVGGTGKRVDEAVNNAKYWAETAQAIAGGGVVSFNGRGGIVVPENGDYDSTQISHTKGSSTVSVSTELNAIQSEINSVQGEINDVQDMYEEEIHGVNLYPYKLFKGTRTVNGVTFTNNGDGTITVTGTASDDANFNITGRDINGKFIIPNGEYIVSGCPSGGSTTTYFLNSARTSGGTGVRYGNDTGNGLAVTVNGDDFSQDNVHFQTTILIKKGYEITTPLVFKPMIRKADIEDSTYRPYNPQAIQHQLDAQGQLGAKNLLPNNTTSQTINGVTFTVNADGSVTVNGTATSDAQFNLTNPTSNNPYVSMILSGDASGDETGTKYFLRDRVSNEGTFVTAFTDTGNGVTITTTDNTYNHQIQIVVRGGQTVSNLIFKPMLRLASDPDSTYQPYAMTNRELTDNVNAINSEISNVENGSTASQAYTVGEYVIRNKIMRKVISAIAQGDALVIGTNLSSSGTTVGEELTELNNSLDNIDVRYQSATGVPEWSPRGADTWHPFSSHYVAYLHYAQNNNYAVTKLADDQLPYSVVTYGQQSMVTYFDGIFNVRYESSSTIIFDCVTPGKLTAANGDSTYYIRILDASHDYYNPKAVIRTGESYDLQIGESFAWYYELQWTYKY